MKESNPAKEAKQIEKLSQNLWGSLILGAVCVHFTFQLLLEIIDVTNTIESPNNIGTAEGLTISFDAIILGLIAAVSTTAAVLTKRILKKIRNNPPKPYFQTLGQVAFITNLIPLTVYSVTFITLFILSFKPYFN